MGDSYSYRRIRRRYLRRGVRRRRRHDSRRTEAKVAVVAAGNTVAAYCITCNAAAPAACYAAVGGIAPVCSNVHRTTRGDYGVPTAAAADADATQLDACMFAITDRPWAAPLIRRWLGTLVEGDVRASALPIRPARALVGIHRPDVVSTWHGALRIVSTGLWCAF